MATSITAQLQAIKASFTGREDPIRRPFIRPSVLFDPKEAADIDLRTILPIAISGLDVLVGLDARFGDYRDTLFSHTSLDLDREKMIPKEEEKVDKSVSSYLRLLSGYLQLPAALKTLEYLIRKYRVHVFNVDDLVLCALPYHDTHAFVRIVQLLDLGNGKWGFLEGVKSSGAPPPRKVIVQQCIRDKGVLEVLCNYASPTKEFQHSTVVVCFCTAVVVEALGAVQQLDSDTVMRVLPFVFSGLSPAMRGSRDNKAGSLMVAGLVASRAALAPKLLNNLISFIARMAQQDIEELSDVPWLRMALMTIVNLVQTQSIQSIPKKALKCLIDIREFPAVLKGLSEEFNIKKFLSSYLETLVDYSSSDASCCLALTTIIGTVQMKDFIDPIVCKVLSFCVKWSRTLNTTNLPEAENLPGGWVKQILMVIDRNYPTELCTAVRKFLKNSTVVNKEGGDITRTLCLILDGSLDMPLEISDSKIWFSLEHPKALVRQAALTGLSASCLLEVKDIDVQKLTNLQDAILRRLHDDELSVVQAALSIDGLSEIITPPRLLNAFQDVLIRCIDLLNTGTLHTMANACEVAILCLERTFLNFHLPESSYLREVATMFFPFILVLPKCWRVSLKALELAKELQWPFYMDSFASYDVPSLEKIKNLEPSDVISINQKTVKALAVTFVKNPAGHIQWLTECCSSFKPSKKLLFPILLQALLIHKEDTVSLLKLFQACLPALKQEWQNLVAQDNSVLSEEFTVEKLERICNEFISQLLVCSSGMVLASTLICIYWSLLKALSTLAQRDPLVISNEWLCVLEDLFVFFVASSPKYAFKEHICLLVRKCTTSPSQFLSKFFTSEGFSAAVQVQSLVSFATICSVSSVPERSYTNVNNQLQSLLCFPSLLIPLSSEDKDIRTAAMGCIEELYKLLQHLDISRAKNGNDFWSTCSISASCFGEFLGLITSQKLLILSDATFLSSHLTSILSTSQSLLVSQDINNRFDQQVKETFLIFILSSGLELSSYGKLRILTLFKGLGNSMLQVEVVKRLLLELLERRSQYHFGVDKNSCSRLSPIEIQILCLLLEASFMASRPGCAASDYVDPLLEALKIDGVSPEDPAIVRPCVAILLNMTSSFYDSLETEMQDKLFANLVFLFHNDHGDIRSATREALTRINVNCSTIAKVLEVVRSQGHQSVSSNKFRRSKESRLQTFVLSRGISNRREKILCFLSSLLDILLLKKDIEKREFLVDPLFKLLGELIANNWVQRLIDEDEKQEDALVDVPKIVSETVLDVQQATLHILQDITSSELSNLPLADDFLSKFNVRLLVECARSTKDVVTLNHVFLLVSSVAKISSQWVSKHIVELFSIIGDSAARQSDSPSQHILEELISTLVPCWQSTTGNINDLLQVFVGVLPDVPENRRLALMVYLLRTLGEKGSLGVLIALLFRLLVARKMKPSSQSMNELLCTSFTRKEWEYSFAMQICDQYSCRIWLPSLVVLIHEIGADSEHVLSEMHLAMQFVLQKLQDTELIFAVESGDDSDHLQGTLGELLEKVILQLNIIDSKGKQSCIRRSVRKQLKESVLDVSKSITKSMIPSEFFKTIGRLVADENESVKHKALGLLYQNVKDYSMVQRKNRVAKGSKQNFTDSHPLMDETTTESLCDLYLKIIQLVDQPLDSCPVPVRLTAVSSLEALARKFPCSNHVSVSCLSVVTKHITSDNMAVSSSCLRIAGALINVLGSKALSVLPCVMKQVLERAHDVSNCPTGMFKPMQARILDGLASGNASILSSVLVVLEEIVENLGSFLNPYLEFILDLLVLHPEYASGSDQKLKSRATLLRKLITEKIHVRLLFAPLMKIYKEALKCGETSISLAFEMLANMVSSMDKSSIGSYHAKIYEHCFLALDLRRQHSEIVKNVDVVEDNVIHAIIVLTMKLTESMFRPLFIRSLDWADSEVEADDSTKGVVYRKIPFYKLVIKLTEQHRSLFVPYFKYLIEGFVHHLTDGQDAQTAAVSKRRKKAKGGDECGDVKGVLSPEQWHLRALILNSLYKCFLYDMGNLRFLDSSNFQVLLKPIVSQLVVEPPPSLEQFRDLPTVNAVDESLVCCLGQMAVTVGSDDIWKQLNHEVLMQTRSEKVRARILGLRVVKYLVEHLKEEYLVCLPETIPFLSELLEDVEPPVKSLSQGILSELESLSGESLQQYL